MSYRRWLVAIVAVLCCAPGLPAQPGNITPNDQTKINDAIDRGVRFLQATQTRSGTWSTNNQHVIGYTALPGLTLLECGVPPTDAAVQRAALLTRRSAATLDATYEVALSILFLDRLGNPADKPIIRMLAARLIAGQATTGGWSYKVPKLTQAEQTQMLSVLRQLDLFERPQEDLNLTADGRPKIDLFDADGKPKQDLQAGGPTGDKTPSGFSTTDDAGATALLALFPRRGACIKSSAEGNSSVAGTTQAVKPAAEPKVAEKPKQPPFIPPSFRNLPVFGNVKRQSLTDPENKHGEIAGTTDNSNTQFALLAIWASRRHDVAIGRTLALLIRRFETSQNEDGTWGYRYHFKGSDEKSPPMTCVGLLGLAVGYGVANDQHDKIDARAARAKIDKLMVKGLEALGRMIAAPSGKWEGVNQGSLYYLWSVERVGVLYNLPAISGKDWYRWGAEQLISNQQGQGHWINGGYPGEAPTINTCLALLFLKRANLFRDLKVSTGEQGNIDTGPKEPDKKPETVDDNSASTPPDTPAPMPPAPTPPAPAPTNPPQARPDATGAAVPPTNTGFSGGTDKEGGSNLGMFLGIGAGVAVLALALLMFLLRGKKKPKQSHRRDEDEDEDEDEEEEEEEEKKRPVRKRSRR